MEPITCAACRFCDYGNGLDGPVTCKIWRDRINPKDRACDDYKEADMEITQEQARAMVAGAGR